MIASVSGSVQSLEHGALVLEVGGVGLRVAVPDSVLEGKVRVGAGLQLWTHMLVRQDAITLYGFLEQEQLSLFDYLLKAPGVGPKLALAIISGMPVDVLRAAVTQERAELLSQVPGVGIKTARKIIFYLKDKLEPGGLLPGAIAANERDVELIAALTALGYSVVEAQTT
ncbi:MAG: Holliday junction branch migration protein RuvA, partial [Anaerolineales bacterium]|nr:Holliday junction branch migration protein RuvA [Anaerolineales bacterium]